MIRRSSGDIARRRHCWTVVAVAPLSVMYNYYNNIMNT